MRDELIELVHVDISEELAREIAALREETPEESSCQTITMWLLFETMRVLFHKSRSDRAYIEDFLADLDARDRSTILAVFTDIRESGLDAKGCQFRQIESKLWEIKVRAPGGGYRFFYIMLGSDEMYVLHAYQKQGQKAPVRELGVARKRMREVLS